MIYLNIIASVQIFFIFYFLFFKNNNILNKILAIIIIIPGLNFLSNAINLSGLVPNLFAPLFFIVQGTALLFAPVVFYYSNLMCGKKVRLANPLFVITALILLYNGYLAIDFYLLASDDRLTYIHNLKTEHYPIKMAILNLMFIVMQQIYFTLGAIKVYKFKNNLKNVFSSRSNTKIEFTHKFIILIWILNIVSIIFYSTLSQYIVEFVVLPSVVMVIYGFVLYFLFNHNALFEKNSYNIYLKDINLIDISENVGGSNGNTINLPSSKEILDFLAQEKPYLDPDFTVSDLSKGLNYSQRIVSNVINKDLDKSFSKLINEYRVSEAKALLQDNIERFTIEAIGNSAGFKSRASFYRVFKNETNMTPAEFIATNQ